MKKNRQVGKGCSGYGWSRREERSESAGSNKQPCPILKGQKSWKGFIGTIKKDLEQMLCFTNKGNNYLTPVIKHWVGDTCEKEEAEEEVKGSEKIKWRSLRGLLSADLFKLCVVMCKELQFLWWSPLNLRGI